MIMMLVTTMTVVMMMHGTNNGDHMLFHINHGAVKQMQ